MTINVNRRQIHVYYGPPSDVPLNVASTVSNPIDPNNSLSVAISKLYGDQHWWLVAQSVQLDSVLGSYDLGSELPPIPPIP
jgi:hypothetical protein